MSHPITKTSVCSSESSLHQTISLDEEIPEVNFISEPESYQNDDFIKVMLETFKKEENPQSSWGMIWGSGKGMLGGEGPDQKRPYAYRFSSRGNGSHQRILNRE